MADATLTATRRYPNEDVWGRKRVNIVRLAVAENYRTGGIAFEPRDFGIGDPIYVGIEVSDAVTTTVIPHYDRVNKKIMLFESAAAGTAFAQKTDDEAVPTGLELTVLIIGY
jgi:hypothetical protein